MLSTQAGLCYILDVALQFSCLPLSEIFLSFCLVIDVVIIQFTLFYSCDFHAPNGPVAWRHWSNATTLHLSQNASGQCTIIATLIQHVVNKSINIDITYISFFEIFQL